MGGDNRYQLQDEAVAAYERQKVRAIFRPLAEATLDRLPEAPRAAVLDVACGTGIVARVLRERFGPDMPITGVDISRGMVDAARSLSRQLGGPFDWRVAPAGDMPLASRTFSACFCQQGIQYFPDERGALAEMRRVLADGGLLILTVWAGPNSYFRAQSEAMKHFVGEAAAEKALAPFAYDAPARLPDILAGVGFSDLNMTEITITRVIKDAEKGIKEDIEGSPLAPFVQAQSAQTMRNIVKRILDDCSEFLDRGHLHVPQHAYMFTSRAA